MGRADNFTVLGIKETDMYLRNCPTIGTMWSISIYQVDYCIDKTTNDRELCYVADF